MSDGAVNYVWAYEKREENNTLLYDSCPILDYRVRYPRFTKKNSPAHERVNKYYRKLSDHFIKFCEKKLFPLACEGYQSSIRLCQAPSSFLAMLSCSLTECGDGVLSVTVTQNINFGDSRPLVLKSCDLWSADGYPLELRDIGGGDRSFLKKLCQNIKKQSDIRNDRAKYPGLKLRRIKQRLKNDKLTLKRDEAGYELFLCYPELRRNPDDVLSYSCPLSVFEGPQ
ncbi:MAG: hypothetical protein LBL09_01515 [Oscillospiraceae bacterium]|jgi:hypothetical protein|nr:hypothetical protein [Oscillospiraceae bacterium]